MSSANQFIVAVAAGTWLMSYSPLVGILTLTVSVYIAMTSSSKG